MAISDSYPNDVGITGHPSVVLYDGMDDISAAYNERWNGGSGSNVATLMTMAPGGAELVTLSNGMPGTRFWAAYGAYPDGNEKIVESWRLLQPEQSDPYDQPYQEPYPSAPWTATPPYTHLFYRYLICVGTDVNDSDYFGGGKLPGMSALYNVNDSHVFPPSNANLPSTCGSFELRCMYQKQLDGRHKLGWYYYGLRSPNPTRYYASPGKFYGNGTPDGTPFGTGYLTPGTLHTVELEVKVNSVIDTSLFLSVNDMAASPTASDPDIAQAISDLGVQSLPYKEGELELLYNANNDGILRQWVDGVLVYEVTDVAMRGMQAVGIYAAPHINIYQGGHGSATVGVNDGYPLGPEHYDLGGMVVATEYIGPPNVGGGGGSSYGRPRAPFISRRAG